MSSAQWLFLVGGVSECAGILVVWRELAHGVPDPDTTWRNIGVLLILLGVVLNVAGGIIAS